MLLLGDAYGKATFRQNVVGQGWYGNGAQHARADLGPKEQSQ